MTVGLTTSVAAGGSGARQQLQCGAGTFDGIKGSTVS